ncbi:amidase signature domain-containing protein [Nemania sp. FL0031]|nr:amidase signature domain-containing protein [Nemania sp. FL0031]
MAIDLSLLGADVAAIQTKLAANEIHSVDLVAAYFEQIHKHNLKGAELRALISLAPVDSVLAQAQALDDERKTSGPRGPFHGIPIVIKDSILTDSSLGMTTTCGTAALIEAYGGQNADVVDLVLKAGMVILGKANLSELGLFKADPPNTGGWSSARGQGLSPYVIGGVLPNATFLGHSTPAGSSSGSAVAVAAGFAPIALGAETDGSLVQPASRAGLYAIKPAPGKVSAKGSLGGFLYASIGPIAKSSKDVADMLSLLMGTDLSHALKGSWAGLRVGIVSYGPWEAASFVVEPIESFTYQVQKQIDEAASAISTAGATIIRDVPLQPFWKLSDDMQAEHEIDIEELWDADFRNEFESFMTLYETSPIRSLADLVQYHKDHADVCLPPEHPSQSLLEGAVTGTADPDAAAKVKQVQEKARERINAVFADFDLDVILSHCDGRMASLAAAAGYAVASFPLGFADFNGRAWGMNAISGPGGEEKLLEVMSAWEITFPEARKAPRLRSPTESVHTSAHM